MTKASAPLKKQFYTRLMDVYRHHNIYLPGFNRLTRFMLKTKAEYQFSVISAKAKNEKDGILNWLNSRQLFFGYGVFRSGTTFLADFLNRHASRAVIQHEANVNDYWYYAKAMHSVDAASAYLLEYRLAEIYYRLHSLDFDCYGEINPFLRRHAAAMKKALPRARQFQLVRDPRNVLRSLMSRELFARNDPMASVIYPPDNDPYSENWHAMSRFEKLCWLWSADNRFIRQNTTRTIKFEELHGDFDYFNEKLLTYLGLHIKPEAWQTGMKRVFNSTPRYTFPDYAGWSNRHKLAFYRICGEEMAFYHY